MKMMIVAKIIMTLCQRMEPDPHPTGSPTFPSPRMGCHADESGGRTVASPSGGIATRNSTKGSTYIGIGGDSGKSTKDD
jgi:hypothetical protein